MERTKPGLVHSAVFPPPLSIDEFLSPFGYLGPSELSRLRRCFRIHKRIYATATPRETLDGTPGESCLQHALRVGMGPIRCGIELRVDEINGLILHDSVEETWITWRELVRCFGTHATHIAIRMTIPKKRPNVPITQQMRDGYFTRIKRCKDPVAKIGYIFDHCDASKTILCLKPERRVRKRTELYDRCTQCIDGAVQNRWPHAIPALEKEIFEAVKRIDEVLNC